MKDVVIIGGGIAGLTTAFYLQRQGCDVAVCEAKDSPGGLISSQQRDGFLLEHGPNSSLGKPALVELARDLNLSDQLLYPATHAKDRFIAISSELGYPLLSKVPTNPWSALCSPILSTKGKLRFLSELFSPPQEQAAEIGSKLADQSVETLITRHFGSEFASNLVSPMLGGIWAADLKTLSARSALPKLWQLAQERRSILRGLIASRKSTKADPNNRLRPTLLTLQHGMSSLPQSLAGQLGSSLRLTTAAQRIVKTSGGFQISVTRQNTESRLPTVDNQVEYISAKQVVLASGAKSTAKLLAEHTPGLARAIAAVPHAPLGIIHFALEKRSVGHPLTGFGFLVQPQTELALLGCIFSSSLFANRAPEGFELLTCFVGGSGKPQLSDVRSGIVQQRVITELCGLLSLSQNPTVLATSYYPAAIPNYAIGHYRLQQTLDEYEAENPGLHLLGNWRKGLSVTDRIEEGKNLALKIASQLSSVSQQRKIV